VKIGIISDTHGDVKAWKKVCENYFYDVDMIIHAGDILYHGPRNPIMDGYDPARLAEEINNLKAPAVFARGNCDSSVDQLVINFPIQAPYVFVREEGLSILVNHGDIMSRDEMTALAGRCGVDVFIFGHIHRPFMEKQGEVLLLNPGSPSIPKEGPPTVAVLYGKIVKVIDIDGGKVLMEGTLP